jgi:bifunctional DNA-binding transcriptional regulator/antitoxin component of YhaV-PrlF toxin-antitoxin module
MIKEKLLKEPLRMSEVRLGKITSKRQLTIPKDFYDKLNLSGNVELILEGDCLKVSKFQRMEESNSDYADLVLKSILDEGFTTKEELLNEFRLRMNLLPLAAKDMVADVRKQVAKDKRSSDQIDKELFGKD